MAGGGGTRLWPASRRKRPKQFLPLLPGGQTLLHATVDRIEPLVPAERIFVVTAQSQVEDVRQAVPGLPPENIIAEPSARNTAACIGLGAVEILRRDPQAVIAVIPSDQFVSQGEHYREAVALALSVAEKGGVVTIGIRPSAPETGFGYIRMGRARDGAFEVEKFVEKPSRATAEEYVISRQYLWNSGMFFFRGDRILDAIRQHLPKLGQILDSIAAAKEDREARADELYPLSPSISIDYGVMEKLGPGEVLVVPGDFGWNDVGSWNAIGEIAARDEHGNAILGEAVTVDARGNILVGPPERMIAAVGVSDLVVVVTDDAVLVMPKDRAQDVREVVRALETAKRETYL
jgi:mannose-1-phosphate guanylyltransferase